MVRPIRTRRTPSQHHHAEDVGPSGAEREADADLPTPLADRKGNDAVESHRREDQRDGRERGERQHRKALLGQRTTDYLF